MAEKIIEIAYTLIRFDVIGHNIQYVLDSIENGIVYYHTIGEFHTTPKTEIMSIFRFNEMIEYGFN